MSSAARRIAAGLLAGALAGAAGSACRSAEAIPIGPALRLRLAQDPATLDPAFAVDAHSIAVISQIHDGLVELDPADLSVRPALAERWKISPDGRVYTFHLRPDARFHDGRRVTSVDVVHSFERLLSPEAPSPRAWMLEGLAGARDFRESGAERVRGIEAISERTVRLTLERPFAPFLSILALEAASVIPENAIDLDRLPVGAGPFRLVSRIEGERIILARASSAVPGAFGEVRRVVYRIIPSESTALELYLTGGLDVMDELPAGRRAEIAERLAAQYRLRPQPAVAYLGFNHASGPFASNRALRMAFNHAVDKGYIVRVLNEGKDVIATGVIPHGVPGHDPDLTGYPYDPERARALLEQAGYPGGEGLEPITLFYNTSESQRRIMERVRMDLERIGVRIRLKSLDPPALMKSLAEGEAPLFRMAWLADYPDPDAFLTPTLHSSSGPEAGNFARYANPDLDRLIDRAREAQDAPLRAALYRKAQRLAVEDACWLLLYFYGDETLVKPTVRGLTLPALGDFLAPLHEVAIGPDPAES